MDESTYLKMVSKYYQCSISLADKIIKSAELNRTKSELDKIVEEQSYRED